MRFPNIKVGGRWLVVRGIDFKSMGLAELIALGVFEIGIDHGFHQFLEANLWLPT